jgi:hypothetical protein
MMVSTGHYGGSLMQKVRMNLENINGNAFHLLGAFAANAWRQGWGSEAIEGVQTKAMAGDYDHLLQTLMAHTEPELETPDV